MLGILRAEESGQVSASLPSLGTPWDQVLGLPTPRPHSRVYDSFHTCLLNTYYVLDPARQMRHSGPRKKKGKSVLEWSGGRRPLLSLGNLPERPGLEQPMVECLLAPPAEASLGVTSCLERARRGRLWLGHGFPDRVLWRSLAGELLSASQARGWIQHLPIPTRRVAQAPHLQVSVHDTVRSRIRPGRQEGSFLPLMPVCPGGERPAVARACAAWLA